MGNFPNRHKLIFPGESCEAVLLLWERPVGGERDMRMEEYYSRCFYCCLLKQKGWVSLGAL